MRMYLPSLPSFSMSTLSGFSAARRVISSVDAANWGRKDCTRERTMCRQRGSILGLPRR